MINKVKLSLLFFFTVIAVSCKKEKHAIWISIKNDTRYTIDCKFYPIKAANGITLNLKLDTLVKQKDFYNSDNTDQKPTDLLKSTYDSILITISGLNREMFFKRDLVKNYKSNPYTDMDSWGFEKLTQDFPTNFSRNKTEIDNYYFSIKEENLIELTGLTKRK